MLANQRGIQSVEIAGQILDVICSSDKPLSLSQIAEHLNIAPGSAHIYLVSLTRTGLLKRNEVSLEYEPGALILRLGIFHFDHYPTLTKAKEKISALAHQYHLNVFLTLWSDDGPTVVFYRENAGFLNISFKLGITLPLLDTTTGQLFCAFRDTTLISELLTRKNQDLELYNSSLFQKKLKQIQHNAYVVAENLPTNGITAITVPVFDADQNVNLALTVFNETIKLEKELVSQIVNDLKKIAEEL